MRRLVARTLFVVGVACLPAQAQPDMAPRGYYPLQGMAKAGGFADLILSGGVWLAGLPGHHSYQPGRVHAAIDIHGVQGDPVYAILGGKVVASGMNHQGFGPDWTPGGAIIVRSTDATGQEWWVLYGHLQALRVGDTVNAGDQVAELGPWLAKDGGPHLHLSVRTTPFPRSGWGLPILVGQPAEVGAETVAAEADVLSLGYLDPVKWLLAGQIPGSEASSVPFRHLWRGRWRGADGVEFSFWLDVAPTSDSGQCKGQFHWQLRSARGRPDLAGYINQMGTEYVRGRYDPQTRGLELAGYSTDRPEWLGLDEYHLTIAEDGLSFSGTTRGHHDKPATIEGTVLSAKYDGLPSCWRGDWVGADGHRFKFLFFLQTEETGCMGVFRWTLTYAPPRSQVAGKEGQSGLEYVRGSYNRTAHVVNLSGYHLSNQGLLALDQYRLDVSADTKSFSGRTRGHGKFWASVISGTALPPW